MSPQRSTMGSLFDRHSRKMAFTWLLVMIIGTAAVLLYRNVYRSEGRLFVRLGRENVTIDPTATIGQGPISSFPLTREAEIHSVVEILRGRTLVERLVDTFSPETILENAKMWKVDLPGREPNDIREEAIHALQKVLDASAMRKSNLVSVSCDAGDAEFARQVADKWIEFFLEQHRSLYRSPQAYGFFSDQSDLLGQQLKQTEMELLELKNSNGVGAIDEQRRILQAQLGAMEDELLKTKAQISTSVAQLRAYNQQFTSMPRTVTSAQTTGFPNVAADNMAPQLYELQLQEKNLASKLTDDHVLLRQVRQQLKEALQIHSAHKPERTQVTESLDPVRSRVHEVKVLEEAILESLQAKESTLNRQLADGRKRIAQFNETEIAVARLQRQLTMQQASYVKYSENLEQVRIDQALETERISNINIVQAPAADWEPIRPRRALFLVMIVIGATVIALGVGLAAEFFDQFELFPKREPAMGMATMGAVLVPQGPTSAPE